MTSGWRVTGTYFESCNCDAICPCRGVSCGIPGHDRPGTEVHATLLAVKESGLDFRYSGVCGFRTTFDYGSD